jgi:hypothetical protein
MTNLLDSILPDLVSELFPPLTGQETGVVLRKYTDTSDPVTGIEGTITAIDTVVRTITPLVDYGVEQINGQSILMGDAHISIPATAVAEIPTPNDHTLIVDGVEWRIVRVEPVRSGALAVMYILQVRQ